MQQKAEQEQQIAADPAESRNGAEYCPVCSERLQPRSCKLVCQTCGYYQSCSDYY